MGRWCRYRERINTGRACEGNSNLVILSGVEGRPGCIDRNFDGVHPEGRRKAQCDGGFSSGDSEIRETSRLGNCPDLSIQPSQLCELRRPLEMHGTFSMGIGR